MANADLVVAISGAGGRLTFACSKSPAIRTDIFDHQPFGSGGFGSRNRSSHTSRPPTLTDLLGDKAAACRPGQLHYHHLRDFKAGIASGSFLTAGMVICPCSMGTVAAIAHGMSENLIHRAADVHLKERRKLILVPRETPLQAIGLRNLAICAEAGAVILPAMPAFYTRPRHLQDCIDFIVGRICDQLGVEHSLLKRWGEENVERGA